MNKKEFKALSLTKVKFENDMKDLTGFLKNTETSIESIIINNCAIGDTSISKVISVCQNLKSLKELRLINMHLSSHSKEIQKCLQNHQNLKILDISQNGIQFMGEISNLLIHNSSIEDLNLLGNRIATPESLRHLLLGMVNNISITEFHYKIDQFLIADGQRTEEYLLDKKEIDMLD